MSKTVENTARLEFYVHGNAAESLILHNRKAIIQSTEFPTAATKQFIERLDDAERARK